MSVNGVNRGRVTNFVHLSLLEILPAVSDISVGDVLLPGTSELSPCREESVNKATAALVVSQGPRIRCISPLKFIYADKQEKSKLLSSSATEYRLILRNSSNCQAIMRAIETVILDSEH